MVILPTSKLPPRQKKRLEDFENSLPCVYRHFFMDDFPRPKIAEKLIGEWNDYDKPDDSPYTSKPGLIFYGPPRTGKTHLACKLAMDAIKLGFDDEEGDPEAGEGDAIFISAVQWAAECSSKAKKCELDGWTHSLLKFAWRRDCCPGIVVLDDLDKLRATSAVQSELFNLIETITANEIQLIVTTNISGDALKAKFEPGLAEAITERIREFCVPVNFAKEAIAESNIIPIQQTA